MAATQIRFGFGSAHGVDVYDDFGHNPGIGQSKGSLATGEDPLSDEGGSTVEGGVGNLLRAATASLLNAAHPGVGFPRTAAGIVGDVNAALASGNRDRMIGLASDLDKDNNLGCPLN